MLMRPNNPTQNIDPARAGAGEMPAMAQPAPQIGNIAGRLNPQLNTNPAAAGVGEQIPAVRPF
jgi:hypothetical protein